METASNTHLFIYLFSFVLACLVVVAVASSSRTIIIMICTLCGGQYHIIIRSIHIQYNVPFNTCTDASEQGVRAYVFGMLLSLYRVEMDAWTVLGRCVSIACVNSEQ